MGTSPRDKTLSIFGYGRIGATVAGYGKATQIAGYRLAVRNRTSRRTPRTRRRHWSGWGELPFPQGRDCRQLYRTITRLNR